MVDRGQNPLRWLDEHRLSELREPTRAKLKTRILELSREFHYQRSSATVVNFNLFALSYVSRLFSIFCELFFEDQLLTQDRLDSVELLELTTDVSVSSGIWPGDTTESAGEGLVQFGHYYFYLKGLLNLKAAANGLLGSSGWVADVASHFRSMMRPELNFWLNRISEQTKEPERHIGSEEQQAVMRQPKAESKPKGLERSAGNEIAVQRMDEFLRKKGMGLTDFASQAGTSDRTLRKFRQTKKVRRNIFHAIATAMGLTTEDLLKDE